MIKFFLTATAIMLLSSPVMAEEPVIETTNETVATQTEQTDYEKRLELAREMHEIWPIRPKIEAVLENVAQQVAPQNRLKLKAALRKAIKFPALEQASIDSMADIFTTEELKAMVDFYGSKEGRSVSFKTEDYEKSLRPILTEMMDKALIDVKLGAE